MNISVLNLARAVERKKKFERSAASADVKLDFIEAVDGPFRYLAFDNASQAILAHGGTAADALYAADQIAPDAPIYVVDAGRFGWKIWDWQIDLVSAQEALRHGDNLISFGFWWLRRWGEAGRRSRLRIGE
jgi:hypothetical protein